MKKNILGVLLIGSILLSFGLFFTATATDNKLVGEREANAFAQVSTTVEDDLSKFNKEDWFYIEDVAAGMMTLEVSFSTYDIDIYIATDASTATALASSTGSDNPEYCSYNIQTAGTYYLGIKLISSTRGSTRVPYSAYITWYEGEPIPGDEIDPIVSITAPADGATVSDTITISATASDADSGIDYLVCSFGGNNLGTGTSWNFDTSTVENGVYPIVVTAYDVAGNSASDTISVTTDNEVVVPPEGEKIFVAFWASDAGVQANTDEYWAVLQNEGYTKRFDFRDTADFEADFNTVDAYEDEGDTVFFYLFGHGNNNGEDSLTCFAPGTSLVWSSELRVMFDRLEAGRVGYFIESCHSGGFPIDFQAEPYLAMSTSDEDHNSYALATLPGEGKMSHYFFDYVVDGYCAVDAFYLARQDILDEARNSRFAQYPLIADYSDYVWFA